MRLFTSDAPDNALSEFANVRASIIKVECRMQMLTSVFPMRSYDITPYAPDKKEHVKEG